MASITRLLLILVLQCACFACGDHVTTLGDEVIAFKKLRGNPNSQGLVLGVGSNVEGTSDLESTKHPDHREAKLATENMQAVQLKTEMTGSVENSTRASSTNNNSTVTNNAAPPPLKSSPPPSPPIDSSKKNSTGKLPPAPNTTTTVSPSPPASKSPPVRGQACDHGPVIGKLMPAGGEDGPHDSTLTVKNAGKSKLELFIQASNGWKATPRVLTLSKGQNESVTVSVTDNEAAKHETKITISWSDGDCYVNVPAQNVPAGHPSNSLAFLNEPEAFALLLGGSLVFLLVLGVAGVWGCISWRARARRHGDAQAKYQELEMTIPATDAKQGDEGSPSADGWDEVWEDDDWQDTEAVRASSTALTLSSAGLNSRRANKDGWDSSWDD